MQMRDNGHTCKVSEGEIGAGKWRVCRKENVLERWVRSEEGGSCVQDQETGLHFPGCGHRRREGY